MNQNGRYHFAEIRIILVKNPKNIKVITFALGNITRYAPSTPEIAPDAPNAGAMLEGSDNMCTKSATNPQNRYSARYFPLPNLYSMLSPKIYKNNMFPPMCNIPACKNIELKIDVTTP